MDAIGSAVAQMDPVTPARAEAAHETIHGSTSGRRVWRISCGDVINRDRFLTVLVERNRVVLVGPPGETAVLSAGQLGQLRTALREAAELAER
ncbi:hypothetical protein [Herbihabitans rhizosphaerae]|uniref:hypothetical protein n=1 Tax=Herbihabitans rhizosphaerae TaxID=1872711 RepID=UPI001F5F3739|nr:hypothetical protein [Herbihabitans rhizosphaerae]